MPEYLSNITNGRALKAYFILVSLASGRQTITFSNLGELIDVEPHFVAPFLEKIYRYCVAHDLPDLTTLVVRTESGEPAMGMDRNPPPTQPPSWAEVYLQREEAYNYGDWLELVPPTVEDFTG